MKNKMHLDKEYWKKRNPPKSYTDADLLYKGKQKLAHIRVRQAIANGTIQKNQTCEVCGKYDVTVAHHYAGYDYPFSIWWVCRQCNANISVHDGSWTIEDARKFIQDKEIRKIARAIKSIAPNEDLAPVLACPCAICGVPCLLEDSSVSDFGDGDERIICQACDSNLFSENPRSCTAWKAMMFLGTCATCGKIFTIGDFPIGDFPSEVFFDRGYYWHVSCASWESPMIVAVPSDGKLIPATILHRENKEKEEVSPE